MAGDAVQVVVNSEVGLVVIVVVVVVLVVGSSVAVAVGGSDASKSTVG